MSQRDTFIDKGTMMNLLMWIGYELEQGLPFPAILKPKPLWTGKQLLSLIIPNSTNYESLDTDSEAKGITGVYKDFEDTSVVIQQGEIM